MGHLVFVGFSLASIDYFNDINRSMVIVSVFDATMFFSVMFGLIFAGFETDEFFGVEARIKGKDEDDKLKEKMKASKEKKTS